MAVKFEFLTTLCWMVRKKYGINGTNKREFYNIFIFFGDAVFYNIKKIEKKFSWDRLLWRGFSGFFKEYSTYCVCITNINSEKVFLVVVYFDFSIVFL